MIRLAAAGIVRASLAACDGSTGADGGAAVTRSSAFGGGTCPDPDPVRDGPLVDAIRKSDARPVEAILARYPDDPRASAAQRIIDGQGSPDPAQAACFASYFPRPAKT